MGCRRTCRNPAIRRRANWNNTSAPAAPGYSWRSRTVSLRRRDGGERLAQFAIERDGLAFLHFETERRCGSCQHALAHEPHFHGVGRQRARDRHAVEAVHIARQFVAQLQDLLHLLVALVLARGFLESHLLAQAVARVGDGVQQRVPVGAQELHHARDFVAIFGGAHHLLAGAQAHGHLAVDAAGMLGRWDQVLLAAAHLEQVEELAVRSVRPRRASGTARNRDPPRASGGW